MIMMLTKEGIHILRTITAASTIQNNIDMRNAKQFLSRFIDINQNDDKQMCEIDKKNLP